MPFKLSNLEIDALNDRGAISVEAKTVSTPYGDRTQVIWQANSYDSPLLAKFASELAFYGASGDELDREFEARMAAAMLKDSGTYTLSLSTDTDRGFPPRVEISHLDGKFTVKIADQKMLKEAADGGIIFPGAEQLKGSDTRGKGLAT